MVRTDPATPAPASQSVRGAAATSTQVVRNRRIVHSGRHAQGDLTDDMRLGDPACHWWCHWLCSSVRAELSLCRANKVLWCVWNRHTNRTSDARTQHGEECHDASIVAERRAARVTRLQHAGWDRVPAGCHQALFRCVWTLQPNRAAVVRARLGESCHYASSSSAAAQISCQACSTWLRWVFVCPMDMRSTYWSFNLVWVR